MFLPGEQNCGKREGKTEETEDPGKSHGFTPERKKNAVKNIENF